jgi:hypothetical protein
MSEVVATVVRDVSPGLSGAEAALYGAIIAGVFTLLGVIVERLLRLTGFLRFEVYEWDRKFTSSIMYSPGSIQQIVLCRVSEVGSRMYIRL